MTTLSHAFQDNFALQISKGKVGTYIEIGANLPRKGSNTFNLEVENGWAGFSIELDKNLKSFWDNSVNRKNKIYWDDAFFGTQVGAVTRGTYTMRIVDPLLFVKNFVPTQYLQPNFPGGKDTMIYKVQITEPLGCVHMDSIEVYKNKTLPSPVQFIPSNLLTPPYAGLNQIFPSVSIAIFDTPLADKPELLSL